MAGILFVASFLGQIGASNAEEGYVDDLNISGVNVTGITFDSSVYDIVDRIEYQRIAPASSRCSEKFRVIDAIRAKRLQSAPAQKALASASLRQYLQLEQNMKRVNCSLSVGSSTDTNQLCRDMHDSYVSAHYNFRDSEELKELNGSALSEDLKRNIGDAITDDCYKKEEPKEECLGSWSECSDKIPCCPVLRCVGGRCH